MLCVCVSACPCIVLQFELKLVISETSQQVQPHLYFLFSATKQHAKGSIYEILHINIATNKSLLCKVTTATIVNYFELIKCFLMT